MSLLKKMRRDLLKINAPTREKEVCRALQTIFHDMDVGLTDKQAFDILGWDYSSKQELFDIYNKEDIEVTPYENYESIIFNSSDKELDEIEGAIIFDLYLEE